MHYENEFIAVLKSSDTSKRAHRVITFNLANSDYLKLDKIIEILPVSVTIPTNPDHFIF